MKPRVSILLLLVFLAGCARLPQITAFSDVAETRQVMENTQLFPQGDWQLVHAIEAVPPGGGTQTMIGVSRICAPRRTAHCVLMTLEGLVLFEADYDRQISVLRAIGPMAASGFAEGLISDILLIFFAPEGPLVKTGRFAESTDGLRYMTADSGTEDILLLPSGERRIFRYDARNRLIRTVTFARAKSGAAEKIAPHIVLQAHGLAGYRLNMTLVEAQRLDRENE